MGKAHSANLSAPRGSKLGFETAISIYGSMDFDIVLTFSYMFLFTNDFFPWTFLS